MNFEVLIGHGYTLRGKVLKTEEEAQQALDNLRELLGDPEWGSVNGTDKITTSPAAYGSIPEHIMQRLDLYVVKGVYPGGWLTTFLQGNLRAALDWAAVDETESHDWFVTLYQYAKQQLPPECWQSKQVVRGWMSIGGLIGVTEALS